MKDKRTQSDKQQQEQPKKNNWAQKLLNPTTLRNLIQWGFTAHKVAKWLIELIEL